MQTTRPNHQAQPPVNHWLTNYGTSVPLTSHVRMTSIRFQIKRTFKPSHLISSHFMSIMDGLFFGKMSDISQISLQK